MAKKLGPGTRPLLISVTTMIPTKTAMVWWFAEVDVLEGMDDDEGLAWINNRLISDKTVLCRKLSTEPTEGRARVITGRSPAILGVGAIGTITLPHLELMEPGEVGP